MVCILNICQGQFGNRLLHYSNMRQISHLLSSDFGCLPFAGSEMFSGLCPPPRVTGSVLHLDKDSVLKLGQEGIKEEAAKHETVDIKPILGEAFFMFAGLATTKIFEVCQPVVFKGNDVAIHFRGKDFSSWDSRAILDPRYYIKGIKECLDHFGQALFHLFTDDTSLLSYQSTISFLQKENIPFIKGDPDKPYQDFSHMIACDAILSSPSTFAVAAGFIGKKKLIIHSAEWVECKVKERDMFWVGLANGGNNNYRMWKAL